MKSIEKKTEKCYNYIMIEEGNFMYSLADKIFPICRSLTGNGVRETLAILKDAYIGKDFSVHEIPTGTQVFDWTVPNEWNIKGGWIKDSSGKKIVDFADTNLHIMGYSTPVHKTLPLSELLEYVYTEPEQPDVIPYVTSYYKERWGFCMTENVKNQLLRKYSQSDEFEVFIDSTIEPGSLTYADILIPSTEGNSEEIMFSTYICHPSLANNECSGPALAVQLANYVWGGGI